MSSKILGTIVCDPPSVLPGQSVLVTVNAPDGTPYDNTESVFIGIDGAPGSRQWLQFSRPGKHTLQVIARGPNGLERQTAAVEVTDPGAIHAALTGVEAKALARHVWPVIGVPILKVGALPHRAYTVGITAGGAPPAAHARVTTIRNPAVLPPGIADPPPAPGLTGAEPIEPSRPAGLLPRPLSEAGVPGFGSRRLLFSPTHDLPDPDAPPAAPKYTWVFGDGGTQGTDRAYAEHDYSSALDAVREYQHFDVELTSRDGTVRRTLSVYNHYVHLKKRFGFLSLDVSGDDIAQRHRDTFAGWMTVKNREATPVTLTERRLVLVTTDPKGLNVPLPVEMLPAPLTVPGLSSLQVSVAIPLKVLPANCTGFVAHYAGRSASGLPVRASAHYDLYPPNPHPGSAFIKTPPLPAGVGALHGLLTEAVAKAQGDRRGTSLSGIRQAASQGTIDLEDYSLARPVVSNIDHVLRSAGGRPVDVADPIVSRLRDAYGLDLATRPTGPDPVTPAIKENDECDPENLPASVPDGFVCQLTTETRQVTTPGRFMNARKGDLLLSPGDNGLIGELLRQVTPPQRYSHSGIMTGNHTEVTHCTASEKRYRDYPVGTRPLSSDPAPTDGFRPDVVRYGWPGVVTQTVENAVHGEPMVDPETSSLPADQQRHYQIAGFNVTPSGVDVGGSWVLIPPLVVKPDPLVETAEVRQQLHAVADEARSNAGKGHYRFFCYTDPTIGKTTVAPPEAKWAAGTFPAVCSSFIWLMAKRRGVHLQGLGDAVKPGDLDAIEREAGADVGPATPDGLYLYTAAERLTGANWLHEAVYNIAYEQTGAVGEFLTKAADHIANEILNSFARDVTGTDDDDDSWKRTQDADAVSPDNLLFWRGPPLSLWGYAEPLIYREPRYDTVTVSRWKKVLSKGTLSGRVLFNGNPVPGAAVVLYDGLETTTDAGGRYTLANVPFGTYQVNAQKVQQDGTFLSAPAVPFTLSTATATLDINLQLPPDVFRTVVVSGKFHTRYTQWVTFVKISDESADKNFSWQADVGPYNTHAETTFTHDVESAHAELRVTLDWQLDKSVVVKYNFTLHDGTINNTDDKDPLSVPEDGWASRTGAYLKRDNDESTLDFVISNNRKQA